MSSADIDFPIHKLSSLLVTTSIPRERIETSAIFMADLARQHGLTLGRLVEEAFEKHFGFPLSQVREKGSLVISRTQGSPIEDYKYMGETFLQVEKIEDIVVEHDGKSSTKVTMTTRYKIV